MNGLRIAAWGVAGAAYVFMGLGVFDVSGTRGSGPLWLSPFVAIAFLAPATVGLLIANRQPRNRIAWIMLLGSFALTLQVPLALIESEGWRLQVDRALWPLLYAWPIAVAYVFPDGHLLSRRWRWVAGLAAASFLTFMTLVMLDPAPFEGDDAAVPNPLAGNGVWSWLESTGLVWIRVPLWLVGIFGSLVAGVVAIHLRLRRSKGIERLQTMWLAWAAALIPLALLLCAASVFALGASLVEWVVFPLILLFQAAVAISVGIAVTRYRLYAIERIVNRTLVYASLTFLLLGAYIGITVGLGVFVGGDSPWVVALATLVVALAFRPLRARIQNLVDRRYRRARYEGVRQVRAFEDEVRDGRRAPEEIGPVVAEALGDPLAELFFWLPESEAYADSTGETVTELLLDARARREIHRDDARTAVLLHDPSLLERRDLLDGVLAAAALSIEMARLRVEVRLQLAEVEASRARIVEAGYEERRRLERDLHDGAQQRLVSLGVQLRRLQLSLPREAQILSPALDQIVGEVGAAIADLRQIAAGVRPARLDEGLSAALRDLARTSPVPVEVEAPDVRVAASVEAAAYFVACEALTNAVKHGSPSRVAMRAVRENGTLLVSISDDGIGGAVVRRGSGLAGLRDRVAAHGGTLEIVSPNGGGTRVEVAIPCES
ncbi:MAG TPA: histidine kinase [Gaiellaceae bacterium]|nr:histidine kinase [Gaiellaceae bacterium]